MCDVHSGPPIQSAQELFRPQLHQPLFIGIRHCLAGNCNRLLFAERWRGWFDEAPGSDCDFGAITGSNCRRLLQRSPFRQRRICSVCLRGAIRSAAARIELESFVGIYFGYAESNGFVFIYGFGC